MGMKLRMKLLWILVITFVAVFSLSISASKGNDLLAALGVIQGRCIELDKDCDSYKDDCQCCRDNAFCGCTIFRCTCQVGDKRKGYSTCLKKANCPNRRQWNPNPKDCVKPCTRKKCG